MPSMTGLFTMIVSVNFDEYLQALGVDQMLREMYRDDTPTTQITNENDEWTVTTCTTFNTTQIKFKLGQEFAEITEDGRRCLSVITQRDEDALVHEQRCDNWDLCIFRLFSDSQLIMSLEAPGGVIATRIYQRL